MDSHPGPHVAIVVTLLTAVVLVFAPGCVNEPEKETLPVTPTEQQSKPATPTEHYRQPYKFTSDWFTYNLAQWEKNLASFKGQPDLHYLEVGIYEGRSFFWMLENVLTHPTARAAGIDIHIYPFFKENLEMSGFANKVTVIHGRSQVELRKLEFNRYDIIYIDGSHTADAVLSDLVLSWELLKPGGVMILDDYEWAGSGIIDDPERPLPTELVPGSAVDAFITTYRNYVHIVDRYYQLVLQKRDPNPCRRGFSDCSVIGDYVYHWKSRILYRVGEEVEIDLSDGERDTIERLIRSKHDGEADVIVDEALKNDSTFTALQERLGILQ